MKKSDIYKLAQRSVLRDERLPEEVKLDIIRELQDREATALFVEEREEKENEKLVIPESTIAEVRRFEEAGTENETN